MDLEIVIKVTRVAAIQSSLCLHGALELLSELMLTSTTGYHATFYQNA